MAHEIHEFLQLPLTPEYLVVSQRPSPNLREVLAWWNHVGATDQRDKEAVQHLQVHGALAVEPMEDRRHVIVLFVRECLALPRHLWLLLSLAPTKRSMTHSQPCCIGRIEQPKQHYAHLRQSIKHSLSRMRARDLVPPNAVHDPS